MAASTQVNQWSSGRCFASMDPERQCEVVGYVRPIDVAPAPRSVSERPVRSSRLDWARMQVDRERSTVEGGIHRRSR